MRADNLLSLRRRPFVPPTPDSRHKFKIVANLARGLEPTGLDQLWVADITISGSPKASSISPSSSTPSRARVVGWALDDHLEARRDIEALGIAITARNPPGLIHHSDRGVQYASNEYAARLDQRDFQRSMSRPGNPYDNAKAESFMKTRKPRRSTAGLTLNSKTPDAESAASSMTSITTTASTPRSGTNRPLRSRTNSKTLQCPTHDRPVTYLDCLTHGLQSMLVHLLILD
jgi:transposase InsO family protein